MQASLKAGSSGRTELKSTETSVIGALAGAVTGLATTPLDVIKTRLMTQGERGQYKGIVDCARQIYREEGSSAFLKVGALSKPPLSTPPVARQDVLLYADVTLQIHGHCVTMCWPLHPGSLRA